MAKHHSGALAGLCKLGDLRRGGCTIFLGPSESLGMGGSARLGPAMGFCPGRNCDPSPWSQENSTFPVLSHVRRETETSMLRPLLGSEGQLRPLF